MHPGFATAVIACALVGAPGVAPARQAEPASEPASRADAGPADPAVLAGPKVHEGAAGKSLVSKDYEGKLRPLDTTAEEAALALLDLDTTTRAKADAILTAHAARLDAIVADNLGLLIRLETSKGGPREAYIAVLRELVEKLRPLRDKGGLRVEIGRVLSAEQKARFDGLLKEYWDAAITEAINADESKSESGDGPGAGGAEGPRRRATVKVTLVAAGQEVKRSFDRQIAAREAGFKDFSQRLDLSPEQDARVRKIFADQYIETLGKPAPEQRRAAVLKAFAELSPQQRLKLASELLGTKPEK